jgi:uncharacterized coiled-coil protein SlyX
VTPRRPQNDEPPPRGERAEQPHAAGQDRERAAIQDAIERLLSGTPTRSTGALTVLQLAAEAGVKRWVLTHRHVDLKDQFEKRRAQVNGVPPAYQALAGRVADLEATTRRQRHTISDLSERLEIYAQVIRELSTQLERLQDQPRRTEAARPEIHAVPD